MNNVNESRILNPELRRSIGPMTHPILENEERRKQREPVVYVWDRVVRFGHWFLVLCFAVLYLRYRKFPLHTYAGYFVLFYVSLRIVWGFVGSAAARFRSFVYSPGEVLNYARQAVGGHAPYYASHNPMGAAMVFALLIVLLGNCILGIMLASAGQQLGPLGSSVPAAWEDWIKDAHSVLGHLTGLAVIGHVAGVLWAAWLHRENYVFAMFTGKKRVPRSWLKDGRVPPAAEQLKVPTRWRGLERWINHQRPFLGSLLLLGVVYALIHPVILILAELNRLMPAY